MTNLSPTKHERLRPWVILAISWVVAFDIAWFCQRASGSHTNDFGANFRESTHYVTGLALRDFLTLAPSETKARNFIERYAEHYPVVDSQIWPPTFHLLESAWMMVFGTSRTGVLMLMTTLAATTAALLCAALGKDFGIGLATLGVVMLLCLPMFRHSYEVVLAEPLAAILLFAGSLSWGRFLDGGRPVNAFAFGILTGLGLLTDSSALALLFQAPISALFTHRTERLRQPATWIGIAIPVLIAGTAHWLLSGGANWGQLVHTSGSWQFAREAIPFYLGQLGMGLGLLLLLFFVVGLSRELRGSCERSCKWSVLAVTLAVAIVVRATISETLDARHLIPLIPITVAFVIAGFEQLRKWLSRSAVNSPQPGKVRWTASAAILSLAVVGVAIAQLLNGTTFRNQWTGYAEGANEILKSPMPGALRVLVSSDAIGNGALTSELAMRDERPRHVIRLSSTELLQKDNRRGGIRPRFSSSEELAAWFPRSGFTMVAVDHSIAELDRSEVHDQLIRATEQHPEIFWPMAQVTVKRGSDENAGVLAFYGIRNPQNKGN